MPGTYSQIYIQYVFAVKYREGLLHKLWREEVFKYMAGIIREKGQKPIIVNGVANHVHVLVGIKPAMSIADLARDIKNNSSKFINERKFLAKKFAWQEGYGAFSYSHDAMKRVYKYIERQEAHHARKKFSQEYIELLEQYQVEYHEKFLFDFAVES
jgi:REP element-mobilizing transposase RayT